MEQSEFFQRIRLPGNPQAHPDAVSGARPRPLYRFDRALTETGVVADR